jgi:hypothetical protein
MSIIRNNAEHQFAGELEEIKKQDTNAVPANWSMSPQAVVTYLMGEKLKNGFHVTQIYR